MIPIELSEDMVRGAVEVVRGDGGLEIHRLPAWARARGLDGQLTMVEAQPSGVRLALTTSADRVALTTRRVRYGYAGAPLRPNGRIDLLVDGELLDWAETGGGVTVLLDPATGAATQTAEADWTTRFALPAGEHRVELWLPHYEQTTLVALSADAPVVAAAAGDAPRWVHHGSSISQGSNADHPTGTWPAVTAGKLGFDLTNLGFGGSALMDPFMARTIAELEADVISLELGINLVNADLMRRRAFGPAVHGWLDTIRDAHPDVPIVLVSPIYCPIHEATPGPGAFDVEALGRGELRFVAAGDPAEVPAGRLTLEVIREVLAEVVAARPEDKQLHLVDGLSLYGPAEYEVDPLTDNLHPSTATHELLGHRFADQLAALLG